MGATTMKTTIFSATALAAVLLAGAGMAFAQQGERPAAPPDAPASQLRTLSVTGTGEASAKPDMATVNFTVQTRGETAGAAFSANAERMNEVMRALTRANIEERDMQTSGLYLNTVNKQDENGRWSEEIAYFEANNTLTVKVRDIDNAGSVIDRAVNAGVNNLGGISFSFSDDTELMNEARRNAVADGRAKAELYAAEAGVTLGEVLYISEPGSDVSPPQPMMMRAESVQSDSGFKVAPGENTGTARINMVFAID